MPFVRGTRYTTLARGAGGNTAPTITVPGAQSATSNVALAITGISISDPESQSQTVSISVSHGTFSLASTTGLSFSVGDGTADSSMTFSGTLANVNTAIATLTYTSTTDFEGTSTFTLNSTDSGGGAAAQKTIAVTVAWNPSSMSDLVAWFDPSFGVYSDAGTTPAVVGDPVYRWVSKNSGSIYAEQTVLANRPILRQGANGKYYLEGNGTSTYIASGSIAALGLPSSIGLLMYHGSKGRSFNGTSGNWLLGTHNVNYPRMYGNLGFVVNGDNLLSGNRVWRRYVGTSVNADGHCYLDNSDVTVDATQCNAGPGGMAFFSRNGTSEFSDCCVAHAVGTSTVMSSGNRGLLNSYFIAQTPT